MNIIDDTANEEEFIFTPLTQVEIFINGFYHSLRNYIECIDNPKHYGESIFNKFNLTEDQQKLFIELYKPDILHQHGGYNVCLNNYKETSFPPYFKADLAVKHLYKDENKEQNLPVALKEFMDWNTNIVQDDLAFYIEYENNDVKSITCMNLEKKNAVKFLINGIEDVKKLIHYSDDLNDNFFYTELKTVQDRVHFINTSLKYDLTPIKGLEEFRLLPNLEIMIMKNYI